MNEQQQEAYWKYSKFLYSELDDKAIDTLKSMPVECFIDLLPDDHTGTKGRFVEAWKRYGDAVQDCYALYKFIVQYEVLQYMPPFEVKGQSIIPNRTVIMLTVADWVNLRDALTLMMTKYWIGLPED